MQLVLGVAVADSTARLALIDMANPEAVLDQFDISVAGNCTDRLVRTIVDTAQSLNNDGHRLTATGICWADEASAGRVRNTLTAASVGNVTVVSGTDAATSFVRSAAAHAGEETAALLLVDDTTAALSVVGPDQAHTSLIDAEAISAAGPDSACTAMLERLREEPGGAQTLYVVSATGDAGALTERLRPDSPLPLHATAHPTHLLARGAAAAAADTSYTDTGAPTAEAQYATAAGPVMGEHLAYSMTDDSGSIPFDVAGEYEDSGGALQQAMAPLSYSGAAAVHTDDPDELEEPIGTTRPRILLLGSTIAAIVVVGFAVLAVGVAIAIKPTASQQAVRDTEAVPGKYLPPMPGQGVEPVKDPTVYLPPVVPVSAIPPEATQRTAYSDRGTGGNSGGYTTSSGGAGGGAPVGAGGVPVGGGNPVSGDPAAGNPLGSFKLSDWLPDLPDNLVIDLGSRADRLGACGVEDRVCALEVLGGCFPGRPGFQACLEKNGLISKRQGVRHGQPEPDCSRLTAALSCAPPKPLDAPGVRGADESADESRSGSTDRSDQTDDRSDSGSTDDPESATPADGSDVSTNDEPPESNTTSRPETTEPSGAPEVTSAAPKPESTGPTTTHTTKPSSSAEPATTPPTSTPSPRSSTPAVAPNPEPKVTSAAPQPPSEPKATSAAPPPPPEPEPAPPAPAPEQAPLSPPEPIVEAPAPAPVVTSEPIGPPASSDDSGSGSSSSSSGSSSNGSDSGSSGSEPATTEPGAP